MISTCVIDRTHDQPQKMFAKNGADIYRCSSCGCIMADISFHHDQYESGNYYTMIHKSKEDIDKVWGFRWRYILGYLAKLGSMKSLLDVGAGNGYFVYLAQQEFDVKSTGLEVSQQEVEFARNILDVQLSSESLSNLNEIYDVVTCFNVLEHVVDPKLLIKQLIDRVRPGGLLVVTTPSPRSIQARVKGLKAWHMVQPPHHINLFSRVAMDQLFACHGLDVVRYETLSTYINFVRKIDTRSLVLRRIGFGILRAFGLGADHFFIFRKVG